MYVFDIRRGKENCDKESKEFLKINIAGVAVGSQERFEGDCRIFRPEGRYDWQIQLVTEGIIDLCDGDIHYSLLPGDCFIIPPNTVNDYIYRTNNPKRQSLGYYVHFSGTAVKELMDKLNISGITVLRNVSSDVSRLFVSLFYTQRTGQNLASLGNLLKIFSTLSDKDHAPLSDTEKAVRNEANYINQHYTEEIDFEKMAHKCNLSRSRFTHVFTKMFGVPPTQYQQNLKLEQAAELLKASDLTVGEIADQCGFRDPLYFSRVFSKAFSVSPTRFKEENVKR